MTSPLLSITNSTRRFRSPTNPGGSAITTYTGTATAAGQTTQGCASTGTSCTLSGLARGVAYGVTVSATNAAGTSVLSAPVTSTPN